MTADPEAIVEEMKPVAAHIPHTVGGRDYAGFVKLLGKVMVCTEDGGTDWTASFERLCAIIVILGEAADHTRLEAVTGYPVPLVPDEAHGMYVRLAQNGKPIPAEVRRGERVWRERQVAARKAGAA